MLSPHRICDFHNLRAYIMRILRWAAGRDGQTPLYYHRPRYWNKTAQKWWANIVSYDCLLHLNASTMQIHILFVGFLLFVVIFPSMLFFVNSCGFWLLNLNMNIYMYCTSNVAIVTMSIIRLCLRLHMYFAICILSGLDPVKLNVSFIADVAFYYIIICFVFLQTHYNRNTDEILYLQLYAEQKYLVLTLENWLD